MLHYEYRVKVGTASFGNWTMVPDSDASTTGHTFTGLTNDTEYTYEVRAENVAGDGAAAQAMVTPVTNPVAPPSIDTVAFSNAGADGVFAIGDAVTATVTFNEAVTVTGTPQLEIDVGGTPKTLSYISGSGSTALVFTGYTVAANDEDTDGLAVAANKLTVNNGTIRATAAGNPDAVLDHAAVTASSSHKVDGVKPTLVTAGSYAPYTSSDGTKIILTFSENIGLEIAQSWNAAFMVTIGGTAATIDSGLAIADNRVELALASSDTIAAGDTVRVALRAVVVTDAAGNGNPAVAATSVATAPPPLPSAPRSLLVKGVSATQTDLSWLHPETGSSDLTGYRIEVSSDGGTNFDLLAEVTVSQTSNRHSHTVASGVTRHYRVAAINDVGTGPWSNVASATAVDTAPGVLNGAILRNSDGLTVYLEFDEALVSTSSPATTAFTVKVQDATRSLDSVGVVSPFLALTLSSPAKPGETVTVSYTKPGTNPLQDVAGHETASFTDLPVNNRLAPAAPDAPVDFTASATTTSLGAVGVGKMGLVWTAPWANDSAIEKYQVRHAPGASASSADWEDIPGSGAGTTSHVLSGLDPATQYTFEVRAVNRIGPGASATATAKTEPPAWELTLTDSNGNPVTELTEGGASATATVRITNGATFSTDQTLDLKHGAFTLANGPIRGNGNATAITIPANASSGSLVIRAPQEGGDFYQPRFTNPLTATHAGVEIGRIDLAFVDDEPMPQATISQAPAAVDEGENIEFEITLTPALSKAIFVNFAVADADGALSGTPPTSTRFAINQKKLTVRLAAAENMTQSDGAREVTFALALNADAPYYTLGTPSTVTVTVRDDDTPPAALRNLAAQAGAAEAHLTWAPPLPSTPDHGQPVLHYEYRVKVGTGSFGSWTTVPGSDGSTTSHRFAGLAADTLHTYEVRARNIAGSGGAAQAMVTPFMGVAVSFAAAALAVDEGASATATLTLAEAPAASVTVPIVATPGAGLDSDEYSGVPASVTFNAGETSKEFTVTTVQDTDDEPDEVLTLSLGTLPGRYVPGTHAALDLTVVDDDLPIVSATFGRAAASVPEGASVEVTVRLSQAPEREVVVPLVATPGANLEANEQEGVPASVTFAADETQKRFTVTFADDAAVEGNETLSLTFGTLSERVTTGAHARLVLTLTDDDGPPAAPDVTALTGDGYVALSWTAVANDSRVTRYEVRWRESDGGTFGNPLDVGLETGYRVEELTNGTAYEFEVRGVNAHGNGEWGSAPATPTQRFTGIPKAVQGLWVKATDSARAELSWGRPANATDRVTRNSVTATFSQIQGYRIEVCRTACGDEADWYALVPNTRKFEHNYVHQVLAPGVIRENRYRVRAININGKAGPWSNVARLDETVVENVYLQTPDDSTLWVRFRVRNPDGNLLHVRYENTGTGAVAYTDYSSVRRKKTT